MAQMKRTIDLEKNMDSLWGAAAAGKGEHPRAAWFRQSKYAMFIHWGLYSEAAGEWNGKTWHGIAEWLMRRARIPVKQYEKLAARFKPTGFSAEAWVRLAKDAGMKYIVLTSKHHEGFAMFHSKASRFNIVDGSPFKRDPIAELAAACKKGGIGLGFYYSQYLDWHEKDAVGNDWDFGDKRNFEHYLTTKALPQITELLTNYGEVALIWFDTPGAITKAASQALYDHIRKLQPKCLVNSRLGNGLGDYSSLGDQEVPVTGPEGLWETVDTHNDTWAYSKNDHHWKGPKEVLSRLVRVVSLGGNYMLNVGPTGKGVIPEASAEILRQAGTWLKTHGHSVYGAGRSPIPAQAWGVCTTQPGKLYLHLLEWPTGGELLVPGVSAKVSRARFLSNGKSLAFKRTAGLFRLSIPPTPPTDDFIPVIELDVAGPMKATAGSFCVYPNLSNHFHAPFAAVKGGVQVKKGWMEKFGDWHHTEVVTDLKKGSEISWAFTALGTGLFNLHLEYDALPEGDGSEFEVAVGNTRWKFPVFCTGNGHEKRFRFRTENLGVVHLDKDGPGRLVLRGMNIKGEKTICVARVCLEPVA